MTCAPSVGIVIVNYNSGAWVEGLLDSLASLNYPNVALIVVDSASADGSLQLIQRRRPDAIMVCPGDNVGTARGNNLGAQICLDRGFDYILFLNDDTTHEPDFLRRLIDAADPRTLTVPRILYSEDHRLINTHAGDFDWDLGLFRNTYHGRPDGPETRQPRTLQTASFCCLLMPAQAFRDAGPLDEKFFMYYEETDLLQRVLIAGYRMLYVPEAVIYHRESASSGGGWVTPFKLYYGTRNRPYLVRKHARSRLRYAIFVLYYSVTRLLHAVRYILRGQLRLLRAMMLGMRDYCSGRMGHTLDVRDF